MKRPLQTCCTISQDMSDLYDELRGGGTDLKLASELANIAGKNLKAKQLDLAERIFLEHQRRPAAKIGDSAAGLTLAA